jgi:hypothetical protein
VLTKRTLLDHINQSRRFRRNLLPTPPNQAPLLSPLLGPLAHLGHSSKAYKGCLGLSKEELQEAMLFKDDMPQCEIVVGGTTVVINSGGESSFSTESNSYESASSEEDTAIHDVTSSQSEASSGLNNEDVANDAHTTVNIEDNTTDEEKSSNKSVDDDQANTVYNAADTEGDEIPNPLHYFDMNDCGSFSALWIFDLALTCTNSSSFDSCSCTAAKIHILYGDIDCLHDSCPEDCHVCDMCMKLTGCVQETTLTGEEDIVNDSLEVVPIAFIGLAAALFGIQLVLFKMYWGRRAQPGDTLGSQLMDDHQVV